MHLVLLATVSMVLRSLSVRVPSVRVSTSVGVGVLLLVGRSVVVARVTVHVSVRVTDRVTVALSGSVRLQLRGRERTLLLQGRRGPLRKRLPFGGRRGLRM